MLSTINPWRQPGARRLIIVIAVVTGAAAATAGAALRGHPSPLHKVPVATTVGAGGERPASVQAPGAGRVGFDPSVPAAAEALRAAPGGVEESTATTF